jgi:type IV secretion system protein VirD4
MQEHDILIGRHYPTWWERLMGHKKGRYIYLGGGEPVALHARTGSGKSVSMTMPNCFTWKGSLVVLDVKGEAFKHTAGYRAQMGQKVYLFDPASKEGRSHRWNPFSTIDRNSFTRHAEIARQANLLFPEMASSGSSTNPFWQDAGRQAFASVATIIAETPEEPFTVDAVRRVFMRPDGRDWIAKLVADRRRQGLSYSKSAVEGAADYVSGGNPKTIEDIEKTITTHLQIWSDPQLVAATSASDFDLGDLRKQPMTIYVKVAPGQIPRLRPLLRLFFDAAINLNTIVTPQEDPTLTTQALFILDEFARLGRIDSLAQAAQYTRGYGLRMAYILQSKSQLRAIYGKDGTADIFDNVGAEIVFGTADAELTQELEKRLGDDTVMFTTRNKPRFMSWMNWAKHAESDHPHRRPLMLDQEIARMSPKEQLIIRPGMQPIKSLRAEWFSDPAFVSRVRAVPRIPELDVLDEMDDGSVRVVPSRDTESYYPTSRAAWRP